MTTATCLCGALAWTIDADQQFITHCHCSRCRKFHGAAFATFGMVSESSIRCTRGADQIAQYQSTADSRRQFCKDCGSPAVSDPWNGLVGVPLGLLDGDPGGRPIGHIFAASKAAWFELGSDLPASDAWPTGFEGPDIDDLPPRHDDGARGGSCLCGAVRYELTGEVAACRNCHCSRCRKARGAAHASNLFTTVDGLRWKSGEDRLVRFELPGAKRFAQVFCRDCGSPMPVVYSSTGRVLVPMGSLDADPGARPTEHIFVASMAPWYSIPDELPRSDEYP